MIDTTKATREEMAEELQRLLSLYANAEAQRLDLLKRVEELETALLAATTA